MKIIIKILIVEIYTAYAASFDLLQKTKQNKNQSQEGFSGLKLKGLE